MKFDTTLIFENDDAWERNYKYISKLLEKVSKYENIFNEKLEEFLVLREELSNKFLEAIMYAYLKHDVKTNDAKYIEMLDKITAFESIMDEKLSWLEPKILKMDEGKIIKVLESSDKLREYRLYFDQLFRSKNHILSEKEEKIISALDDPLGMYSTIYSSFTSSDAKELKVKLSNGETLKFISAEFNKYMTYTEKQIDREKIYKTVLKKYFDYKNTLSSIYSSIVKRGVSISKIRNYKNVLDMFLHYDKVPSSVYHNLIEVSKENSKYQKKYINIRKRALGLKKYYAYDSRRPLVIIDKKYSFDYAKKVILEAVKEFPDDYRKKVEFVFSGGFIDSKPSKNKQNGGYTFMIYTKPPYIFYNYSNTIADVMSLAHEIGHAVHRLYANESQPFIMHATAIFTAEVGSMFLERHVAEFMYKNSESDAEKIYFLQNIIETFRTYFYSSSSIADFEYSVHKYYADGNSITEKYLSEVSSQIQKEHFGNDVLKNEYSKITWAVGQHIFGSPFYVYKYATCTTTAFKLYEDYLKNEKNIDKFIKFLKAGGSDYPYDLILSVGVDLSKKETYRVVNKGYAKLVDKLDKLIK